MPDNLMEKIVSLCKRRGFIYPGSEIYGGLANFWDFGPLGAEMKNNLKQLWWKFFVQQREDIVGLDSGIIMNPKVWEASGHLTGFNDLLVECKKCQNRFRIDDLQNKEKCPECQGELTKPRRFNTMFKTFLGPVEDNAGTVYLRPETAQGMFVDFKNILDSTRVKLPFGIAQIGQAFRNEITPGNFIFRLREFEMMEIEYFIKEKDWEQYFEKWRQEMRCWMEEIGLDLEKVHEAEISKEERAHYSQRTIDFEYEFPFGQKELYGLAYRTDFDLKNHFKEAPYKDGETGEKFWPHVIEPTWGVERSVLAILCEAYDDSDKERIVLKLKPKLAPNKVAVFPLLANKPKLVELAREICNTLRLEFMTAWDDRGNIGKRYFSQDEIGTPFCVTVDFKSLEDQAVTVRERDSMKQERIKIGELKEYLEEKIK